MILNSSRVVLALSFLASSTSGFSATTTATAAARSYRSLSLLARHARSSRTPRTALNMSGDTTVTTTSETPKIIAGPALSAVSKTAKRLFFVRHGEVINPGGADRPVYYGAMDVPLSVLGQQEAAAAGAYLQQFALSKVFCSPLQRAVYGAEQVLLMQQQQQQQQQAKDDDLSLSVIILDGFKELDRGAWCGKTKDEIGAANMKRFDACDESVTPGKGGESYPALKARVLASVETCLGSMEGGEAAAVVSHLQVTRSVLSEALGIPIEQMASLAVATASVTCIDYDSTVGGGTSTVHFQSFKPDAGLEKAKDGAN